MEKFLSLDLGHLTVWHISSLWLLWLVNSGWTLSPAGTISILISYHPADSHIARTHLHSSPHPLLSPGNLVFDGSSLVFFNQTRSLLTASFLCCHVFVCNSTEWVQFIKSLVHYKNWLYCAPLLAHFEQKAFLASNTSILQVQVEWNYSVHLWTVLLSYFRCEWPC